MKKSNMLPGITAIIFAVMLTACPSPDTTPGGTPPTTTSGATINGTVTVDDDSIDITTVVIILTFYGDEKQRLNPGTDGKYAFTDVEKSERTWFKVRAELAGFESAVSSDFALTGDFDVEVLNLTKIPPNFTGFDFKKANVLTVTFDGAVEIDGLEGFKIETNLDVNLYAAALDCASDDFDVWEITMNRSVEGYEKIMVTYDNSTKLVREKGTKRFLHTYEDWAGMSFTKVMPLEASVITRYTSTLLTIVWSKDVDLDTMSIDGWTISVDGDEIDIKLGFLNTAEASSISLSGYSMVNGSGDVVNISYDATRGAIKAIDGGILESFTYQLTL